MNGNGTSAGVEHVPTVVVGGGQAGLVAGYHLQRLGEEFLVVDACARTGDSWRQRWDSLRLFSPPRYASLPGWPIQVSTFPTRDEMADYLEAYAAHFALPIRHSVRVERLSRVDGRFWLQTTAGPLTADRVIVATGGYPDPVVPEFAVDLDPSIRQLHSSAYRRPDQLTGDVLVVGAGNSGADIALEAAAAGHRTTLAGRHPGQVPFDIDKPVARILVPITMFAFRHVFTLATPPGRAMAASTRGHGLVLVRHKIAELDQAGIRRVGRVQGVTAGRPVLADGEVLDPATVVWCTGFRDNYRWIDLPIFDAAGEVVHRRGIVEYEPGLYFLGMHFQYAVASGTIQGLDQDARHLIRDIRRHKQRQSVEPERSLVTVAG